MQNQTEESFHADHNEAIKLITEYVKNDPSKKTGENEKKFQQIESVFQNLILSTRLNMEDLCKILPQLKKSAADPNDAHVKNTFEKMAASLDFVCTTYALLAEIQLNHSFKRTDEGTKDAYSKIHNNLVRFIEAAEKKITHQVAGKTLSILPKEAITQIKKLETGELIDKNIYLMTTLNDCYLFQENPGEDPGIFKIVKSSTLNLEHVNKIDSILDLDGKTNLEKINKNCAIYLGDEMVLLSDLRKSRMLYENFLEGVQNFNKHGTSEAIGAQEMIVDWAKKELSEVTNLETLKTLLNCGGENVAKIESGLGLDDYVNLSNEIFFFGAGDDIAPEDMGGLTKYLVFLSEEFLKDECASWTGKLSDLCARGNTNQKSSPIAQDFLHYTETLKQEDEKRFPADIAIGFLTSVFEQGRDYLNKAFDGDEGLEKESKKMKDIYLKKAKPPKSSPKDPKRTTRKVLNEVFL